MVPLEQCSGSAYRWDTEVQRSFRVLETCHKSHSSAILRGQHAISQERACLHRFGTFIYFVE